MVILVPPEAPITERTRPVVESTITVGTIDDKGLFPGTIKFAGLGGTPKPFVMLGEPKSSISLLKIIPVCSEANFAPKLIRISNE